MLHDHIFSGIIFTSRERRDWTGGQWVQWETRPLHVQGHPLHLRKFPLHFLFCFSISNLFPKTGGKFYF